MKTVFTTLAVSAGMAGTTGTSLAQETHTLVCGQREHVVSQLRHHYGESVRSIGLAPENRIVEIFTSEETGSWTITVTSADGTTCLMASGQHFETLQPEAPGEPL